ncbi:MAG: FCD domain-containing protein [Chloroflexi bacterium]|nr:FCD domain-containing protein [Chloroflexota bacterium]
MRKQPSELLNFIFDNAHALPDGKLPSLDVLSVQLRISTGKLREQLEVARVLGIVEVRPRTGIRLTEYAFAPAVRFSLLYALSLDHNLFDSFSALRNHVEFAFFHEAVAKLTADDYAHLKMLVQRAWDKLENDTVRIPHAEHRDLHLTIFSRLNNPFVRGLLEAYWDAYEAEGLSVFSDYDYLHEVWQYHDGIVNAIVMGSHDEAYRLLVQHTRLIQRIPKSRSMRPRNSVRSKLPEELS